MNRSQKIRFNKARKYALSGEFEKAIPILETISEETEEAANASLAEVYGFLFDWENCLKNAGNFIANPNSTYAGNVFDEMIKIIGRAAHETHKWKDVEKFCENAVKQISVEEYQKWQKTRYIKILTNLKRYAKRNGQPPHELIEIFGVETEFDELTIKENRAAFDDAVENVSSLRPDLSGRYDEIVRHKISLAILFHQLDEATKIFLKNEDLEIYDFKFLIPIIKHLIEIGEKEKAWQIVENKITYWIPVDIVQIAPVEFLVDEDLKTIINSNRSLKILKTPRHQ
jgi:tetratricopeptide (TPR) repeat protein